MTISPISGRQFSNSIAFAGSHTAELNGFVGGGQVGYNYQISPRWLVGFETDIQSSAVRGTDIFTDAFSAPFCVGITGPPIHCTTAPFNGTATTDYQAKIQWFGTVRGRLGVLVTDRVLVYGTGGLAYGRVKVAGSTNVDGLLQVGSILTPGTSAFAAERTNVGFAVGCGIEGKIFANWTWKLEYLHLDLGSLELGDHIPSDCRERRCYSCRRHYDDAYGIHRRHRARRTHLQICKVIGQKIQVSTCPVIRIRLNSEAVRRKSRALFQHHPPKSDIGERWVNSLRDIRLLRHDKVQPYPKSKSSRQEVDCQGGHVRSRRIFETA